MMVFAGIAYSIPVSTENSNTQGPTFFEDNLKGIVNSVGPNVSSNNRISGSNIGSVDSDLSTRLHITSSEARTFASTEDPRGAIIRGITSANDAPATKNIISKGTPNV